MKLINKSWEMFRESCIHKDASENQVSELKLAFYAGASVVTEAAKLIGKDEISEDQGVKILSDVCDEVDSFIKLATENKGSSGLM